MSLRRLWIHFHNNVIVQWYLGVDGIITTSRDPPLLHQRFSLVENQPTTQVSWVCKIRVQKWTIMTLNDLIIYLLSEFLLSPLWTRNLGGGGGTGIYNYSVSSMVQGWRIKAKKEKQRQSSWEVAAKTCCVKYEK